MKHIFFFKGNEDHLQIFDPEKYAEAIKTHLSEFYKIQSLIDIMSPLQNEELQSRIHYHAERLGILIRMLVYQKDEIDKYTK